MARDDFKRFMDGQPPAGDGEGTKGAVDLPVTRTFAPLEPGDLPARLGRVVERSLEQADEILSLRLDRGHPQYAAELRAKTSLVNTALSTQARVDETMIKRQGDDGVFQRLLKAIADAKANNPALCEPPKSFLIGEEPAPLPPAGTGPRGRR